LQEETVGEIQINYLAVLAAGVFSYLLGTIWYSGKLFAKPWREAVGKTESEIRMSLKPVIYVITFVCWIIASYVLAVFVHYSKAGTFGYGMLAGFLCWFGFIACISLFMILFSGRPLKLWLINSGYTLIAFLIGGGIIAAWR